MVASISPLFFSASYVRGSLTGSNLLTGGAFGPESSIIAVLVCLAAAIFLLYRAVKLGRIEPPAWTHTHWSRAADFEYE